MRKIIEKIKYPKFLILTLTITIGIIIFSYSHIFSPLFSFLLALGIFGIFLTEIFYSYSFTSIPATAVLLVLAKQGDYNLILIALIAGVGAVIGDLLIFKFIQHSFDDELKKFSREKIIIYIKGKAHPMLQKYFMLLTGFLIIASPLPDEVGVFLVAEFTEISTKLFTLIAFILDTCGILVILIIGTTL